jgi:hypothetical protein
MCRLTTGHCQTLHRTFQSKHKTRTYMIYVLPEMFFVRPDDGQLLAETCSLLDINMSCFVGLSDINIHVIVCIYKWGCFFLPSLAVGHGTHILPWDPVCHGTQFAMVPTVRHGTHSLTWYPQFSMVPTVFHGTHILPWYPHFAMVPTVCHGTNSLRWYPQFAMVPTFAVRCAICVEAKAVVSVMHEFHGYCV